MLDLRTPMSSDTKSTSNEKQQGQIYELCKRHGSTKSPPSRSISSQIVSSHIIHLRRPLLFSGRLQLTGHLRRNNFKASLCRKEDVLERD
ncbi:unnamed protein product [Lactuca virosa]|uniref:Uncharacterized protein n=1 Tax=Lactuca virosa TaxID=75947 RepID=A0AAU9LL45_9ASTR|nr:unnamed protein product [Lactuca virosa]